MSGVEDGQHLDYSADNGDGQFDGDKWTISIGRREDRDIWLRHDIYVSRQHAYLHCQNDLWSLEDCDSTNGTFIEDNNKDEAVAGTIAIMPGILFRVGRTWLRIDPLE